MSEAPTGDGREETVVRGPRWDVESPGPAPTATPGLAEALDPAALDEAVRRSHKMALIGSLVPGLIHDLNNPLSAIRAFSQLLSRDPRLPDDLRGDAELLVEAADRTRQLAMGVLEFARSRPPERHPTPLGPLVRSVVDLAAYALSSAQVRVTVDLPSDLPLVPVDRAQMQQVLLELALSAIGGQEAEANGGTLAFSAAVESEPASHVVVSLTRDGAVPRGTPRPPAHVVSSIVASHGGRLRSRAAGNGMTWTIELPLDGPAPGERPPPHPSSTDAPAPSAGPAPAPADAVPAIPIATSRPRVLVLDDEPAIRRFLSKALSIAGCDAVEAESGSQALTLVADPSIAAVLCDHRMAGMTGTEVYDAVLAARPDLGRRFVFMSGDIGNPELTSFADRHGLALLAKPFDLQAVARAVTTLLGTSVSQS